MQAGKTAEAPETTASSPSHSQKILDFSFLEVADVSELVDKLDIAIDAKEKDADKTGKQRVLKVQRADGEGTSTECDAWTLAKVA